MKNHLIPLLLLAALLCVSCQSNEKKWRIGISQCSEDIWRYKQNYELQLSQYADPRIDISILSADDNDERQIEQIRQFLHEGIDLLIVAPNKAATLSEVIDSAYDSGVPVVLFDRKTNSDKYSAFMGADNYALGSMMGAYIAKQMQATGTLVEITGLKGSSPAIERHRGFMDALQAFPGIQVISSELGDWTEESGEIAMQQILRELPGLEIDCVFGHNDRLALGARRVLMSAGKTDIHYYGVDALPTAGGGMECVQQGILEASCIYPTRGLQLMKLATDILDGKPYERVTTLTSTIVNRRNVDILLAQYQEQQRVSNELERAKSKIDEYFLQLNQQRKIILAFIIVTVIIITLVVLAYRFYAAKLHLNEEMVKEILAGVTMAKEEPKPSESEAAPDTPPHAPAPQPELAESSFLDRFRTLLQNHLHEPDFNVERMGEEIGMSRVQLYRKVKTLTGQTPVELLRKARLTRALHLLQTTDRSISEIGYEVGFSAPSYFAKCFKDEYGKSPGEMRNES